MYAASTASMPTRSRRSPRRRTSRWRRPATHPSPNSTTSITIRTASRTPIPPSSRGGSSPRPRQRASALTLLPVFYAQAVSAARRDAPGQRRFVHSRTRSSTCSTRSRARRTPSGYTLGVAPHSLRAVTPEEFAQDRAIAAADAPIHIHAAEQTREVDECYAWSRMRPVEWLLDARGRRRALVRRPCDAHDRARESRGSPRAARSPGSRRRPRPTSATASSRATRTCRRAAASASAPTRTR